MTSTFKLDLDTPSFKGLVFVNTGLFINGAFVDPIEKGTIDVVNPSTGKVITTVASGTSKDVDVAVQAARNAYRNAWGLKVPGKTRARVLSKLADLIEANTDELAAIETLNVGKLYKYARGDVAGAVKTFRYFAGWADKVQGKTIETDETKMTYTRHEPYGVCGHIIPWNFPLLMLAWKIAPAIATGNTVVLKPSEVTPLSALKFADLLNNAGVPPGVVNIVVGYGHTVGQAISEHPHIAKIAFTGSTLVGRKIMEAASRTNLKAVTLELGGKSPNIIFDDADLEQAVKWAAMGIFFNMGQVCIAGSRIFVQEGIYPKFIQAFTAAAKGLAQSAGDPFGTNTGHGPQVSQTQFDRIMGYIDSGKKDGANIIAGGDRIGNEGYFLQPTVFTDCNKDMKIVREEIFGPVAAIIKFKDEEEVIEMANDTVYGLACAVFTENGSRAFRVAHAIEAGTAWINCYGTGDVAMPFGGYKQSGIGREMGEYALSTYTQVKSVHVNLSARL